MLVRTAFTIALCSLATAACSGCAPGDVEIAGDESESGSDALTAPAQQDWSLFPDWHQCLTAVQAFYPAKFGAAVPQARNSWTGDCAPDGACHIWLDDIPNAAVWERIPNDGTQRPSPYDLVVYPPTSSNPYGHVASVDHVDAAGNVFVMDANANNDLRKAQAPHTVARAPYGWYHLRALPKTGAGSASRDLDGDGCADVLGLRTDHSLRLYGGACSAGFKTENVLVGTSWGSMKNITVVPDFDGKGVADVVAVDPFGYLRLYGGQAGAGLMEGRQIGHGWGVFNLLLSPGDFDGDGRSDIIGRLGDGRLLLYSGNGAGGFAAEQQQIGYGFQAFDALVAPGDFTGDGCADLVGRLPDGTLRVYPGNCHGALGDGYAIGNGWGAFDALLGRDFDADGCGDLIARAPNGELWLYPSNCAGSFRAQKRIGTSFDSFLRLF